MVDADIAHADALLLGDGDTPPRPADAAERYRAAAGRGSGAAYLRLALMAAQGVGRRPDWIEALDLLADAAAVGDDSARGQLAVLAGAAPSDGDWRQARRSIDLDALLAPPGVRGLCDSPRIGVMEGFAPAPMAWWLIESAGPRLERSRVYEGGDAREDTMRTSSDTVLDFLHRDMVLAVLQQRLANRTRLPVPHHEPPNVLSYMPGEQFCAHVDFLDPEAPAAQDELEMMGQRVISCITYLNDDYAGGETEFVELGMRYKGKLGDCLMLFNVGPDRRPDWRTRHAGLAPTSGRKWVLAQFIRDRMLPLM